MRFTRSSTAIAAGWGHDVPGRRPVSSTGTVGMLDLGHDDGMRPDLPSGTVTFLFTDVEGSTRLLRELGAERYAQAIAEHRRLLRAAFSAEHGVEVDTQGDAFFYAFASAAGAVAAADRAQAALASGPIRVRIGVHTGKPHLTEEGYVGEDVHLGARIASSAHGGQVVISRATKDLVEAELSDLGEHRLKDFAEPVWIFQLGQERFPPLKTISNTNLPRPASSFVGRERERTEVVSLLRGGARLVTLSGPGGSGKTRLSIESAAELVPEFRNGVFWVGLAAVHEPELVWEKVAQTLGAQDGLAEHVGERELLLLLDNFEQVVEAAPELASLLESCPNLRLLVTSRELLRVRGEVEYPVPPLAESDAVELFCARSHVEPDETVAELCRGLDNLPLAVELASARTSVLSPAQILERLSQRLDLLKGGRDAEARQQTLRATIAWSYDLLSPGERTLFARLSVFVGGCTLGAAEAVGGAELDTLQSLVDKSLLRFTDERFWMLETIREYATERLEESGEAEGVLQTYAEFFLALAESAHLSAEDFDAGQRYELIAPEADNLRGAIDWALAAGQVVLAAELIVSLEQFWVTRNPNEGRRRTDQLVEYENELPTLLRARVLRVRGGMTYILGDFAEGNRWAEAALAEFRQLGDETRAGHMLQRLAVEAHRLGDLPRARALIEEGLSLDPSVGGRAQALNTLASVAFDEGEYEEALDLFEQSAGVAESVGNRWLQSHALLSRAQYALMLGQVERARLAARAGLRPAHAISDQLWMVWGVSLAAWIAAGEGRDAEAGRLWGALEAESERAPIGQWEGERENWVERIVSASPEFEKGREAGRRLTLEEAVEQALRDD
jgi:predicted ATPase/class 3 adenylate cyclase